jgi:uncharacterized membrane protein
LGPLYFAVGHNLTGSYAAASFVAVLLPVLVALAAVFVKPPVALTT